MPYRTPPKFPQPGETWISTYYPKRKDVCTSVLVREMTATSIWWSWKNDLKATWSSGIGAFMDHFEFERK